MKCDFCGQDKCFWSELFYNGRYKYFSTGIEKRKMTVCEKCLKHFPPLGLVKDKSGEIK